MLLTAGGLVLAVTLPPDAGSANAVSLVGSPTSTLPGSVITLDSPNATSSPMVPGAHQDPADLYGIVLVVAGIAAALFASRWLFGRKGPRPSDGRPDRSAAVDPGPGKETGTS